MYKFSMLGLTQYILEKSFDIQEFKSNAPKYAKDLKRDLKSGKVVDDSFIIDWLMINDRSLTNASGYFEDIIDIMADAYDNVFKMHNRLFFASADVKTPEQAQKILDKQGETIDLQKIRRQ